MPTRAHLPARHRLLRRCAVHIHDLNVHLKGFIVLHEAKYISQMNARFALGLFAQPYTDRTCTNQ